MAGTVKLEIATASGVANAHAPLAAVNDAARFGADGMMMFGEHIFSDADTASDDATKWRVIIPNRRPLSLGVVIEAGPGDNLIEGVYSAVAENPPDDKISVNSGEFLYWRPVTAAAASRVYVGGGENAKDGFCANLLVQVAKQAAPAEIKLLVSGK